MSQRRKFSERFKKEAVGRMRKGESPSKLSRELKVLRKSLYEWKEAESSSELEQAQKRIGELERKVGQQELELDFFDKALRCIEQAGESGRSERSTNSSGRKPRKAN